MKRFYVGVKALIRSPQGRVLLLQRERDGGCWWDLPGGRLEDQEDIADGMQRELLEEIGQSGFTLGRLLAAQRVPDFPDGTGLMVLIYDVRLHDDVVLLSPEHIGYAFVEPSVALSVMPIGGGCSQAVRDAQTLGLRAALTRLA